MNRDDLVNYLNDYLQVPAIQDVSNNGLQVEGRDAIQRVALAVDASLAAFVAVQEAGAEMLIVHHGLFWGKPLLVTGVHRRRLAYLLSNELSLYAAHLPLDFHEEVGNNATLARWLELEEVVPFGDYKGYDAGLVGSLPSPLDPDQFVSLVQDTLGQPVLTSWVFGPATIQRVAVCSGDAASLIDQVAAADADVFVTGEMSHTAYHQARELGLNVVFGGHYATETGGLQALGDHLGTQLGLESVFLDLPTGA